jgi:hypothetical protein
MYDGAFADSSPAGEFLQQANNLFIWPNRAFSAYSLISSYENTDNLFLVRKTGHHTGKAPKG